jgi:hypothetical protein
VIDPKRYRTLPDLTPAQQYLFLRKNPICTGAGELHANGLDWRYWMHPTAMSRDYLVHIDLRRGEPPKIFIREPDLTILADGRELPHVYHDPIRLCLFLPGTDEWVGSMRIDQTFVPWTATWLYYFEEWLSSDEWKGGGEHPQPGDHECYNRRVRRRALGPIRT